MHTETVNFQLSEALADLQRIVAELDHGRMGPDDTAELAGSLCHVLRHICKAWNARELTLEQMAAASQDEHDRMFSTVPNFFGQLVMGEGEFG
jgi:hypothetical protein